MAALLIFLIPFILTIWNILILKRCLETHCFKKFDIIIEIIGIFMGFCYLIVYADFLEVRFVRWDEQLYNNQVHSFISPDHIVTVCVVAAVAFIGYLLIRLFPVNKMPPLLAAISIAAIYLGILLCILLAIQTLNDLLFILLPGNLLILFIKTIYLFVYQKNIQIQEEAVAAKYKKLSALLNKATNLPVAALILVLPLLGIIIIILILFGQEPSSIIKAWTQTADWTLSMQIAPQNIYYDEHYLCTVAAGGHRKIVKPLRTGIRHGHTVIVNRQLCIANAFEQILEEKTPRFHKIIRKIYDNTGYPISKHIRSRYTADIIYFAMKPLELFFLAVIYFVDQKPEDRIAVQYPHTAIPK